MDPRQARVRLGVSRHRKTGLFSPPKPTVNVRFPLPSGLNVVVWESAPIALTSIEYPSAIITHSNFLPRVMPVQLRSGREF